jgi:hypothetical protein
MIDVPVVEATGFGRARRAIAARQAKLREASAGSW